MDYKYVNKGWVYLADDLKLSKVRIAKKLDLTTKTVYRYVKGDAMPTLEKLIETCQVFDLDISLFIERKDGVPVGIEMNSTNNLLLYKKDIELELIREYEQKMREQEIIYVKKQAATEYGLKSKIKELENKSNDLMEENRLLKEQNIELQNKLNQCGYGYPNLAAERGR